MARKGLSIEEKIERAKKEVEKAKEKYDAAVDNLDALIEEEKNVRQMRLLEAIENSGKSNEEILEFLNSKKEEISEQK